MKSLDFEIGQSYELIGPLGMGASAVIGLYRHRILDRKVAIKFYEDGPLAQVSFETESAALAALSNVANIGRIYDASVTSSGTPYIVMEYYEGPSLLKISQNALRLPLANVLRYSQKLANAIAAVHVLGLAHGDIKPNNVLTDYLDEPYIVDFGSASFQRELQSSQSGTFTPAYAAPELILYGTAPTASSDTYSLAATIWTLLEGHPPTILPGGQNTLESILRRARTNEIPQFTRQDIPESLISALTAALSTDADMRPSSSEFAREMHDVEPLTEMESSFHRFPSREELGAPAEGLDTPWGITFFPWGQTLFRSVVEAAISTSISRPEPKIVHAPSQLAREPMGTVAILTAIPDEMNAVTRHLKSKRVVTTRQGLIYTKGNFNSGDNRWDVVCACIGPGNMSSALVTQQTVLAFDPDLLAFVGVAGGIKDVVRGDVVVASRIIGYEGGKDIDFDFLPRPAVFSTDFRILQHCTQVSLSNRWKLRVPRASRTDSRVFLKPIVAGEKVLSSRRSPLIAQIRRNQSDAIAIEMEGLGMYSAASFLHTVPAVSIRGISDLLSGKKAAQDEEWQPVAAANAAAFFFEALSSLTKDQLGQR